MQVQKEYYTVPETSMFSTLIRKKKERCQNILTAVRVFVLLAFGRLQFHLILQTSYWLISVKYRIYAKTLNEKAIVKPYACRIL